VAPPHDDRWTAHHALGAGGEFDAVRALLARWGDLTRGIGDDAAVLDVPPGERLVVSTDSSVEDRHFRRDWLTPEEIGYRATTAALSDLAAMGARPLGVLLAIAVPRAWRAALDALADGIGDAVRAAGATIVGGDLTGGRELAITATVLGATRAPVGRAGARAGDAVYVTGRLGGPLLALRAFERGERADAPHRDRFVHPAARIREGAWLAARGATAMIDVSDGLAADLAHVAAASGARIAIDPALLPLVEGASVRDALASGEEYELALTAPAALDVGAFAAAFGVPLTRIGTVVAAAGRGAPRVELVGAGAGDEGSRVDLPGGHDHFSI
jgi:thiamine-monophosphate kinase